MQSAQFAAVTASTSTWLPSGDGDRAAAAYGVIGLPFASGHYLAFRDFAVSSFGPAYRSVWHRDPSAGWSVYSSIDPDLSCPRFLGAALSHPPITTPIDVTWPEPNTMRVYIDDVLDWTVEIAASRATRLMTTMSRRLPMWAWSSRMVLALMGRMAGPMLSAGRMRLSGGMPNGQEFRAAPRRIWSVDSSRAMLRGVDLGPVGPLPEQDRLGDFWLPQRGIFFADGFVTFELPASVGVG